MFIKADLLQSTFRVKNQNLTHPPKCQVDHIPLTHHLSLTIITNITISSQVRRQIRLVILPKLTPIRAMQIENQP